MGIPFPDLATLESMASIIVSQMHEGIEPAPWMIELMRDYCVGDISMADVIKAP
jgi:putative transcriptional regulator